MKILAVVSRILVGTLFIFSGLIKANDILGFSYKLEEYWVEFGIGWDWLIALDVPLSALICIAEIVLGMATILGYRMKITSILLLSMIVFFTILTFASAQFGLVKSCGCFGDAIPLTPWESFYKDIILLFFIVVLFVRRKHIQAIESPSMLAVLVVVPAALMAMVAFQVEWNFPLYFTLALLVTAFVFSLILPQRYAVIGVVLSLVGSAWFSYHTLHHLPVRDFRPYAIGKSIPEQMKLPEGALPDIYKNVFVYRNKTSGEEKEFNDQNYPWEDDNWEFVDRVSTLVQKGDEAKITDFSISDYEGMDYTADFLHDPDPILIFVAYNISKSDRDGAARLGALGKQCVENGVSIIGLSASDQQTVEEFRHEHQLMFDFYATDEITLKTMIRSNPGIMLLKEGMIIGKWHFNDTPDWETFTQTLTKS
jgi:uncharacterized membrane protein YphA (DoxX/SURF4 family)